MTKPPKQTLLDFHDFHSGSPLGINPALVQSVVETVPIGPHCEYGGCIVTMKGGKEKFFVRGSYLRIHDRINAVT